MCKRAYQVLLFCRHVFLNLVNTVSLVISFWFFFFSTLHTDISTLSGVHLCFPLPTGICPLLITCPSPHDWHTGCLPLSATPVMHSICESDPHRPPGTGRVTATAPAAPLWNPSLRLTWGHTSHRLFQPVTSCSRDTRQAPSWETWDSSYSWFWHEDFLVNLKDLP